MLGITDPNAYFGLIACLPMKVKLTDEIREALSRRGANHTNQFDTRLTPRFHCCGQGVATLADAPSAVRARQEQSVVIVRDISRTGIGLLTHEQWFPEQVFHILLPDAELLGRVRRARYINTNCFEIGLSTEQYRAVVPK